MAEQQEKKSVNIISILQNNVEISRYKYDAYGNYEIYKYNHNNELVLDNDSISIGNKNPFRYKSYYIGRKRENRLNEVVFIVEKRRIKKKGISNYKLQH